MLPFMIPDQDRAVWAMPKKRDCFDRIRTSIDHIADRNKTVVRGNTNFVQQFNQLGVAPVNITNDYSSVQKTPLAIKVRMPDRSAASSCSSLRPETPLFHCRRASAKTADPTICVSIGFSGLIILRIRMSPPAIFALRRVLTSAQRPANRLLAEAVP